MRARHTATLFRGGARRLIEKMFVRSLHHKQVMSLFMISCGVLSATRLGVAAVGQAMARMFGKQPKHGIKQVDRYLSKGKATMTALFAGLVPVVIGNRRRVEVTMDWTEFDKDDQSTIALSMVTPGKRTQPLVWLTVKKSGLKGNQKRYEREALEMLQAALPKKTQVIIVADRGFGDVTLYEFIVGTLGFDFVIRYRQCIHVRFGQKMVPSSSLVPRNGRIRVIRDTILTSRKKGCYSVVLYKAAGMKDSWCLATNLDVGSGREIVNIYSRRFQCEETFRDLKDHRYGYGLNLTKIRSGARRDRFILVFVVAYLVQTLMGIASEQLGLDKQQRANTETRRTHSLFNQGRSLLGNLAPEVYGVLANTFRSLLGLALSAGFSDAYA